MRSEPLAGARHTIAFNRGVASSQAYAARFADLAPDKQPTAAKRQLALDWLSRDLDETRIAFLPAAGARPTQPLAPRAPFRDLAAVTPGAARLAGARGGPGR